MTAAAHAGSTDWDVAVIGGGIGGLTAAATLADAGARVLVCEQHDRPGGYCHGWSRVARVGGRRLKFTFDASVHDVSGAYPGGPVRTILDRLGLDAALAWARTTHEYQLPSCSLRVPETPEEYVRALQARFHQDAGGIEELFCLLRTSFDELHAHAVWTGGLPRAPRDAREMRRFREKCPTLCRFIGVPFVRVRDALLGNPELRRLVSILAAYVTDDVIQLSFAHMLPLYGYYFRGGHYPRGGSQRLADLLVARLRERGGELRLRAPVARIEVARDRVSGLVLGDGARVRARAVISNADPQRTLRMLDPGACAREPARAATPFQPSNSAFMVFLGLDIDPPLPSSVIIAGEDEGVILSRPPFGAERAPQGHSTLTLTALVPSRAVHAWRRDEAGYEARKRAFGDRLIALAAQRVPQLGAHIVLREDGSPATLARYSWATNAAAYGATPDTRWPGHQGAVQGLFLVGASTGLGPASRR